MSQTVPVNKFGWIKDTYQFDEDFIKNYNEESKEGYFLEVDVQCLEKNNLHDKSEYVIHIRNLKQALNHGLAL